MSCHLSTRQSNNIKLHEFSPNVVMVLYIKENDLVWTCVTHGKVRKSCQFCFVVVQKSVALRWAHIDTRVGKGNNIHKYWKGNLTEISALMIKREVEVTLFWCSFQRSDLN
jgi:hypothetical protein